MGAVGVDIHKQEYQFRQISFSDIECIKGLIKNRHWIDPYFGNEENFNIYEAGEVLPVNQELIGIFESLDNLIKNSRLNKKQLHIVNMYFNGSDEDDIADFYNQDESVIRRTLENICRKIKETNDIKWKYEHIYLNYLKSEWEYKRCSKCGENKPLKEDFFAYDKFNNRFKSRCLNCHNSKKD